MKEKSIMICKGKSLFKNFQQSFIKNCYVRSKIYFCKITHNTIKEMMNQLYHVIYAGHSPDCLICSSIQGRTSVTLANTVVPKQDGFPHDTAPTTVVIPPSVYVNGPRIC